MPVEAQCRSVVSECSSAGLDGGLDELLDGFAGMLGAGIDEHGANVDLGGFALQYAVGEEHQSVARFKRECLHAECVTGDDAERRIGLERHYVDDAVT